MAKKKHKKQGTLSKPKKQPSQPEQLTIFQPGDPGVPNPTVEPFFTPEDLLAINDYETNEAAQLADLNTMLDRARIDRDYELTQAEDQHKKNVGVATDEMIGRGLFASSVKDAALYDLQATLGLQRSFLNDRFNQVVSEAATRKDLLLGSGGARERFWSAMNQKKAQNATELGATMGPWKVEPTEGKTVTVPVPPAATKGPPPAQPPLRGPGHWGQNRPYVSPFSGHPGSASTMADQAAQRHGRRHNNRLTGTRPR